MSEQCPKRETMSLEETTISNMWEIAAIVEVLEQKGRCTTHNLLDADREVHRRLTEGQKAVTPCPPMTHITQASIHIRIHATAHTPGSDAVSCTFGQAHIAIAEVHEPHKGRIECALRRRPIADRQDAGKDAGWDERRR